MLHRIKTLIILLVAASLLSACQLFEPLPTLPVALTLPPVVPETISAAQPSPASSTPEIVQPLPATASQASPASASATATLPAVTTNLPPTKTQTIAPSATSLPANQPTRTAARPAPTRTSNPTWKDVPIMPGATDGKEEQGSYSYVVGASVAAVQDYYNQSMPLAGWAPFATGTGEEGNLLLMYQKGNITATIGLIEQGTDTLVLIVAE